VTAALSLPCTAAVTVALADRRLAEAGMAPLSIALRAPSGTLRQKRTQRLLSAALAVLLLACCGLILYRYQHRHYNLDIETLRATEITAHRGASAHYPENTMAAFIGAWEQGADWIELDVRESSDGQIYVMHDSSFLRTAGLKRKSWELSWEEISRLDAGSAFSKDFAGEPIPLLSEVLDFARWRGIRLNIELKPTRYDQALERRVAELIYEYGLENDCVVTSQNYAALQRVKEYAPDLTCVYVMSFAIGDFSQLTAADHFSIESTFITRRLVENLHQMEKQVYAWTIDQKDAMERLIALGVDNIITNDVPLGKQLVSADAASDLVLALLEGIAEESPEE